MSDTIHGHALPRSEAAREHAILPAGLISGEHVPSVAPKHGARDFVMRRALAAGDMSALLLGAGVTALVSPGVRWEHVLWLTATIPFWIVLFAAYGLYGRDIRRISHAAIDDLPGMFHAFVVGACLTWARFEWLPPDKLLFPSVLCFALVSAAAMLVSRVTVRALLRRVMGPERVLFVGGGPGGGALMRKMQEFPGYGLKPVGVLTRSEADRPMNIDVPVLGSLEGDAVDRLLQLVPVDRVLISGGSVNQEPVLHLLRRCKQLSIKVSVLPEMFDAMGPNVEIDNLGGITLLGINPPVLSRSSRTAKRAVDLIGASLGLIAVAPLMLIIAIAIKLDSRGPVFFRQQRVGRGGRRFKLMKFRSMSVDAEARRSELVALSKDPNWLHVEDDPRITKVGRRLRHLSLDELPQLWNVLVGDMSLVGPRPLIEVEDAEVDGWWRARLDLTPGITGLWQVLGRTSIPFEEMIKLDYVYVTNWSLWGDVKLILRTLPVVLRGDGAN